jgi:hypothetical protein
VFEGDVEEVAGAAGGIEDASATEAAMEVVEYVDGVGEVAGVDELGDGGDDVGPVGAERLDDGRDDEALDVGAGSVVGAELVALVGVEGAFEESAEDGGLDVSPVGVGGVDEQGELIAAEGGGLRWIRRGRR